MHINFIPNCQSLTNRFVCFHVKTVNVISFVDAGNKSSVKASNNCSAHHHSFWIGLKIYDRFQKIIVNSSEIGAQMNSNENEHSVLFDKVILLHTTMDNSNVLIQTSPIFSLLVDMRGETEFCLH